MKAVTLIGTGPSWKECRFSTEELWGTASCLLTEGLKDKNFTKVFAFDSPTPAIQDELAIARERNIPIVSSLLYATEPFDRRKICRKLKASYWMSTMSYMISYALYLEYDGIYVFGIDQGPQWYYQFGKTQIVFWLGYAACMVAEGKMSGVALGRGSLRWAYSVGLDSFPKAFMEKEKVGLSHHLTAPAE